MINNETITLFNDKTVTLNFKEGLTLLSGENGTAKTKILEALLQKYKEDSTHKAYGFSPKRNTAVQDLKEAVQNIEASHKTKELILNEFLGVSRVAAAGFSPYPSFSQLFVIKARELYDTTQAIAVTKSVAYQKIAGEFNTIIENVFSNLSISVLPDENDIVILKKGVQFPVSALSTGEREVISLIINFAFLIDSFQALIVDEPEVHLNWGIEKRLFEYFDRIAQEKGKQIIVATHSRIVFTDEFRDKTIFLDWKDGLLQPTSSPSAGQIANLAGESVQFIDKYILDFHRKGGDTMTFFVEDENHESVIKILSAQQGKQNIVHVIVCGGKEKVIGIVDMLNRLTQEGDAQYVGVVDSDNEITTTRNVITLERYCIENYFLDFDILAEVMNEDSENLSTKTKTFIQQRSTRKLAIWKDIADSPDFTDHLKRYHDAKSVLKHLLPDLYERQHKQFIETYLEKASEKQKTRDWFGDIIEKL